MWKRFFRKTGSDYQTNEIDKKIVWSMFKKRWPGFKQLKYLQKFLNHKERLFLFGASILLLISLIMLGSNFYQKHLITTPSFGGEYTEGMVGSPQYINPLHAPLNTIDASLARLIYSALLSRDNQGRLINDLAENIEMSADGKTYTIKIVDDAHWHNGEKLTADDVVFTFNTIKDPQYKSPLRISFQGVEIEKVDDYTVRFNLEESFASFKELLTFGIMPQAAWQNISPFGVALAELNLKPIGSGPYKFYSLTKDKSGNIKSYTLINNDDYYRTKPYLEKITCRFFVSSEEALAALNDGRLDGLDSTSWADKKSVTVANSFNFYPLVMPEYTAIFFNLGQADDKISKPKFREALMLATNQEEINKELFNNQAININSPLFLFDQTKSTTNNYNPAEASKLLGELGWAKGEVTKDVPPSPPTGGSGEAKEAWLIKANQPLSLTITTADTPELTIIGEMVKKQWETLGIKVTLEKLDKQNLLSSVINPRSFSILLYNVGIGTDPDFYPLWHSSQVNSGGFNLSGYKNSEVDKLINQSRQELDNTKKQALYLQIAQKINQDRPAIFLFSQPYLYLQSKKVKGLTATSVAGPEDRFLDATNWHLKEKKRLSF
jgi:peptide/nickel transport system substrate-binding protein